MKQTIQLLLLLLSYPIFSQDEAPITYGKVSEVELSMKFYDKDSTADAVILADYGEYSFNFSDEPKIIYQRIIRIKILKKSGYSWASGQFFWLKGQSGSNAVETVERLEGTTYNYENGAIATYALSKDAIFQEKQANGWQITKFTMPQVREGSVIEYRYIIESNRWYAMRDWEFQRAIPTQWSELRTTIPGYFDYKIILQSFQALEINKQVEGQEYFMRNSTKDPFISYRFAMKDVPALPENEPFVTTIEDYRYKLEFELARTFSPQSGEHKYSVSYQDITNTLLEDENFGKALKKFSKTAETLAVGIKSPAKDTLWHIASALKVIREKMKWNDDSRLYTEDNLQKVFEKGIGNSSEINLMLVRLLRELGYEANPVILSTRGHGKINQDFALLNRFNYVIAQVWVNGKDMLLDATEDFLSLGTIPKRCLNKQGWLVQPKKARWVSLTPNTKYGKYVGFDMEIGENQMMKGKIEIAYMGYAAADFRKELAQTGKEKYLENYQKKFITWQDPKFEINGIEDLESAVKIDCQTSITEAYTMAGNRIYLQPLLGTGMSENPFKLKERSYPIDFAYPTEESIIINYTLPKGYVVEELPKNDALSLPENGGKFFYEIKQEENQLKISSRVQMRKTLFGAESYPAIRAFYDRVVSKHAEQIILKKVK